MFAGLAGVKVDIKVIGAKEAAADLQKMIERSDKLQPVFEWARVFLRSAWAANFAANGLPSGSAWDPLDPQYGAWKSVNFPGAPTLVRTGNLFRSLTETNSIAISVRGSTAEFGTTVEYAKFHQQGTTKMPKRQIVFEPPGFANELSRRIGSFIVDGEVV